MADDNELSARLKRVERLLKSTRRSVTDPTQLGDNAVEVIDDLLGQAKGYREEIKALKDGNAKLEADLKAAQQNPATADDIKELASYRELGKPGDLKAALDAGKKAEADLAVRSRKETIAAVAGAYGWNADALAHIDNPQVSIESDTTKNDKGEDVARFYAVVDGKKTPYDDYIKNNHAAIMPALESGTSRMTGNDRSLPPQRRSSALADDTPTREDYRQEHHKRLGPSAML